MVLCLVPQVLSDRFQLTGPNARRRVFGCPPKTEHVARHATRGKAAPAFEELDKSRQIQPPWRSDQHMNVRFHNRQLDDIDVMTCGRLLEKVLEKSARLCVDHRQTIMRRPSQVNEDLVSRHVPDSECVVLSFRTVLAEHRL
jgi:hypothetical protein